MESLTKNVLVFFWDAHARVCVCVCVSSTERATSIHPTEATLSQTKKENLKKPLWPFDFFLWDTITNFFLVGF